MKNKLNVGDMVVKNPKNWVPNDFDGWGRGVGIGVVVEPPFDLSDDEYDVRWPNGRCFESGSQLLDSPKPSGLETREWNYFFNKGDEVKFAPDLPDSYFVFSETTFYDPLKKFKDCRDSVGVVVGCRPELHAFGRGSIYICDVDFDGIKDTILAMYLVKYDKENKKEKYAVYEKVPAHGREVNGIILAPYSSIEEAQEAREKYGYNTDNYYVDKIKINEK